MDSEEKLVLLCPEAVVAFKEEKIHVTEKLIHLDDDEENCKVSIRNIHIFCQEGGTKYLDCNECHGKGHKELEKTGSIEHPLHPKHLLILVKVGIGFTSRKCYCCARFILNYIYCCPKCDFIMNLGCVKKSPVFTVEHQKRHKHTLTLFPRQDSITCNVCALNQSSYPIYICPPCDFVVHKSCIDLPWESRISRHHHRISFTHSFLLEDLFCGICRRKIDSNYGGYSCNKEGCSYVAHSRCATRENIWDGKELEGEPEDVEEEVEPFERINDGIIRHFCHENHHLRLDEDVDRVYDEIKYCHICSTPIYYGSFYSCMQLQCGFIIHETCANLPRKTYHPIHPHLLTLVVEVHDRRTFSSDSCSACHQICGGFFYQCCQEECRFKVHVQCATVSEPLIHESQMHALFLTSEPGERRTCSVCKEAKNVSCSENTFNCIECDFVLCFRCAVLPQNVRYKHDEHTSRFLTEKKQVL